MQPARHQIVHQVVATGDSMEHLVDERLLVVAVDLPEAERRGHTGRERRAFL